MSHIFLFHVSLTIGKALISLSDSEYPWQLCFSDNLCNTVDSKYENTDAISFSSVHKILKTARSRQQEFFYCDVISIYMIRGMLLNLILYNSCQCSAIRLTMFYMKYSVHRPLEFLGLRILTRYSQKPRFIVIFSISNIANFCSPHFYDVLVYISVFYILYRATAG